MKEGKMEMVMNLTKTLGVVEGILSEPDCAAGTDLVQREAGFSFETFFCQASSNEVDGQARQALVAE